MKGQMSLEMIIGLLILLVVAFVVIRMFLTQTGGITSIKDVRQSLQYSEFKQGCDQICKEGNIAKWCSTKLKGDTDLNRNQRVDAIDSESLLGFKACEDGIYCMNMFPCVTDTGKITPEDCKQTLCSGYYDSYRDWTKANQKVKEIFPNAGVCTMKNDENWYSYYGFNSNTPCGGSDSSSSSSGSSGSGSPSLSCSKGSDGTSAVCQWSCPNTLQSGQNRVLTITITKEVTTSLDSSGTYTFKGLAAGNTYRATLLCDSPVGVLYKISEVVI